MRNRKTIVHHEETRDDQDSHGAQRSRTKAKKNEIAIRHKNVTEIVAEAASSPGAPVEMLMLQAKQEFHRSLIAVELPSISKDNKITLRGGGGFRVASFENIHAAVMPLLRDHGLRMFFQEIDQPDRSVVKMNCVLTNGLYEEPSVVTMPTAPASPAMSPQQAHAAAMTFACRHGTIRLLNLNSHAPEDRDIEITPEDTTPITAEQAAQAQTAVVDNGVPGSAVEKAYGVKLNELHKLPATRFAAFLDACANYGKRAKQ